jgi:adenine phosphoribosyltransferase
VIDIDKLLKPLILDVPDFPKPGVVFKDFTPLMADPAALALSVELLANPFRGKGIDQVVGAESRGFIFGIAVARAISAGFVPIRKPGKLPREVIGMEYELEYGTDRLEMQADAIKHGERCLLVDDLLATGGTMRASCDLVAKGGGEIAGVAALIELTALGARAKLTDVSVIHTVISYG